MLLTCPCPWQDTEQSLVTALGCLFCEGVLSVRGLVLSSKINSSDISPRFFQQCGEPLQTGTLSWPEPLTPFECMVHTKEKMLAMLEGHLFKSIHPNFLKH